MTNEELLAQTKELIEKSLISTTDLATAGKLNPEQVDKFIDFVIDVTELAGNVRVVRFKPETLQIHKLGLGRRVAMAAAEAVAPSVRRGVVATKITLTPQEVIVPFELTDSFLEINVEGESVEQHIVRMMATQTGNDLEEMFINGDALGHARTEYDLFDAGSITDYIKDTYMALMDGWLRLADAGNVYDAGGADLTSTIFSRMLTSLPVKFRRVRRDMRFLCSSDHEQWYREKLASRATGVGDAALQGQGNLTPFGVPLIGVPLLESEPIVVEHFTVGAAPATASLRYGPIGTTVVVTTQALADVPTTPYVETTDYTVNRTTGVVTTVGGGALNAGGTIKVTYYSNGQVLFTNFTNLILAISRDVRIEKDRDIYKRTNEYAISTKVDVEIEEVTATVKGVNIGLN